MLTGNKSICSIFSHYAVHYLCTLYKDKLDQKCSLMEEIQHSSSTDMHSHTQDCADSSVVPAVSICHIQQVHLEFQAHN